MAKPKPKPKARTKRDSAIKLSLDALNVLKHQRKRKRHKGKIIKESYDTVVRRLVGLPQRDGTPNTTRVYYLLTKPQLKVYKDHAEAKGQAILNAVRMGKSQAECPITVREII